MSQSDATLTTPSIGRVRVQKRHFKRKQDLEAGLNNIREEIREEMKKFVSHSIKEHVTDFLEKSLAASLTAEKLDLEKQLSSFVMQDAFQQLQLDVGDLHVKIDGLPVANEKSVVHALEKEVASLQDDMDELFQKKDDNARSAETMIQALTTYGVPSGSDMRALVNRVATLEKELQAQLMKHQTMSVSPGASSSSADPVALRQSSLDASYRRWDHFDYVEYHRSPQSLQPDAEEELEKTTGESAKCPRVEEQKQTDARAKCAKCMCSFKLNESFVLGCLADGSAMQCTESRLPRPLQSSWKVFCRSCWFGIASGDAT